MKLFKSQSQKFDKTKNERGITLVALIITIIILIILAAVTINSLTHDGLAEMAIKGAQDYDKAQQNEMNMLNDIDSMVRDTIKNIEDGTRPDEPTPPDFTETIEIANNNIGKSVDYSPKANQSYNVEAIYSGHSSDQSFNTSNITGGWSLWGVDDKNIYVIADNTTSNKLTLANHLGYNNGVTLLDTLCDTCFTDKDTYPNMKGQNLKLEQVLAVTNPSNATNGASVTYGSRPYSYSFKYPYIWNQYEKSEAAGSKDWETNRSKAYPLTTQTALTSNITYSPYSNYWYYGSGKNWNSTSYWKNAGYHRMVMTPAQSAIYWLSSRCVIPNTGTACHFGLQSVNSSGVDDVSLYCRNSSGSAGSYDRSFAVRPLVSFPMADYTLQNDTDTIKIVKRS